MHFFVIMFKLLCRGGGGPSAPLRLIFLARGIDQFHYSIEYNSWYGHCACASLNTGLLLPYICSGELLDLPEQFCVYKEICNLLTTALLNDDMPWAS